MKAVGNFKLPCACKTITLKFKGYHRIVSQYNRQQSIHKMAIKIRPGDHVLVRKHMDVNVHERLSNITLDTK